MGNETKSKSTSKLAQALQDAAIANINEDINSINDNLENITTDLPKKVKAEVELITNEMISIRKSLNEIPVEFDQKFTKKINKIFSVLEDVEFNTKKLNHVLLTDIPEKIMIQFKKKTDGLHLTSTKKLFLFSFLSAFSGVIFWIIFSKIILG